MSTDTAGLTTESVTMTDVSGYILS